LEIATEPNPWVEFVGMYKDDPLIDEWKRAVEDYRKTVDENYK